MIYVILKREDIGKVMDGKITQLPVFDAAPVGSVVAVKTARNRKPTVLLTVTACDPDPEGYTLTVRPRPLEHEPLLLRSGSPLTGGGKARLMSSRKRRPGKAKAPGDKRFTDEQAVGYTDNPMMAMRGEPEAVPVEDLDVKWSFRAGRRHEKAHAERVEQARMVRERLDIEQRMIEARKAARLNHVDASGELALVRKFIRQGRSESSVMHRLAVAERVAHREAA